MLRFCQWLSQAHDSERFVWFLERQAYECKEKHLGVGAYNTSCFKVLECVCSNVMCRCVEEETLDATRDVH